MERSSHELPAPVTGTNGIFNDGSYVLITPNRAQQHGETVPGFPINQSKLVTVSSDVFLEMCRNLNLITRPQVADVCVGTMAGPTLVDTANQTTSKTTSEISTMTNSVRCQTNTQGSQTEGPKQKRVRTTAAKRPRVKSSKEGKSPPAKKTLMQTEPYQYKANMPLEGASEPLNYRLMVNQMSNAINEPFLQTQTSYPPTKSASNVSKESAQRSRPISEAKVPVKCSMNVDPHPLDFSVASTSYPMIQLSKHQSQSTTHLPSVYDYRLVPHPNHQHVNSAQNNDRFVRQNIEQGYEQPPPPPPPQVAAPTFYPPHAFYHRPLSHNIRYTNMPYGSSEVDKRFAANLHSQPGQVKYVEYDPN